MSRLSVLGGAFAFLLEANVRRALSLSNKVHDNSRLQLVVDLILALVTTMVLTWQLNKLAGGDLHLKLFGWAVDNSNWTIPLGCLTLAAIIYGLVRLGERSMENGGFSIVRGARYILRVTAVPMLLLTLFVLALEYLIPFESLIGFVQAFFGVMALVAGALLILWVRKMDLKVNAKPETEEERLAREKAEAALEQARLERAAQIQAKLKRGAEVAWDSTEQTWEALSQRFSEMLASETAQRARISLEDAVLRIAPKLKPYIRRAVEEEVAKQILQITDQRDKTATASPSDPSDREKPQVVEKIVYRERVVPSGDGDIVIMGDNSQIDRMTARIERRASKAQRARSGHTKKRIESTTRPLVVFGTIIDGRWDGDSGWVDVVAKPIGAKRLKGIVEQKLGAVEWIANPDGYFGASTVNIRGAFFDTPEIGQAGGREAADFAKETLSERICVFIVHKLINGGGRVLADIHYLDDGELRWYGREVVEAGHALVYAGYRPANDPYHDGRRAGKVSPEERSDSRVAELLGVEKFASMGALEWHGLPAELKITPWEWRDLNKKGRAQHTAALERHQRAA